MLVAHDRFYKAQQNIQLVAFVKKIVGTENSMIQPNTLCIQLAESLVLHLEWISVCFQTAATAIHDEEKEKDLMINGKPLNAQ